MQMRFSGWKALRQEVKIVKKTFIRNIKKTSFGKANVANQTYNEKASIGFLYFVSGDSLFRVIPERFHYDLQHFENRMQLFKLRSEWMSEWANERAQWSVRAKQESGWAVLASGPILTSKWIWDAKADFEWLQNRRKRTGPCARTLAFRVRKSLKNVIGP